MFTGVFHFYDEPLDFSYKRTKYSFLWGLENNFLTKKCYVWGLGYDEFNIIKK